MIYPKKYVKGWYIEGPGLVEGRLVEIKPKGNKKQYVWVDRIVSRSTDGVCLATYIRAEYDSPTLPQAHPELQHLLDKIEATYREGPKVRSRRAGLEVLLEAKLRELLQLPKDRQIERGSWECVKSPTLFCIYDLEEDPVRDSCLICGHPEERK